jgi:RHS repeat-associated protein
MIGTADWDAWGNLNATSSVAGAFGWTREQRDAETGLTYLRGRYYAPGSARFLTRHVISPNTSGNHGYSGYNYADCNPVTRPDPRVCLQHAPGRTIGAGV